LVSASKRLSILTRFLQALGLVALTWLVFGQTLGHEFINYDDPEYVFENPQISQGLTLHGMAWAFSHRVSHNWHPLTTITHMIARSTG
jgi:protein O-mannosyl-transferase